MTDPNQWRRIVAVLANPELRRVFAELVLDEGEPLTEARRDRALGRLRDAGMVGPDGRLHDEVFTELLAAAPPVVKRGVERFLDADGRIVQWPTGADDRAELLEWLVERVLPAGESVDERTLTERLAEHSGDPVAYRRYLVDAGLVARSRDGAAYRRA